MAQIPVHEVTTTGVLATCLRQVTLAGDSDYTHVPRDLKTFFSVENICELLPETTHTKNPEVR